MSKQLKLIFALLHLCLAYNIGAAQQLQLKISSSDPVETTLINTIGYSNTFEDYKTLEAEIYTLKKQLLQQGFIETQKGHRLLVLRVCARRIDPLGPAKVATLIWLRLFLRRFSEQVFAIASPRVFQFCCALIFSHHLFSV